MSADLQMLLPKAMRLKVRECEEGTCYYVKSSKEEWNERVELDKKTCTCGKFQEMVFPCVHALAAIVKTKQDVLNFIHPAMTVIGLMMSDWRQRMNDPSLFVLFFQTVVFSFPLPFLFVCLFVCLFGNEYTNILPFPMIYFVF